MKKFKVFLCTLIILWIVIGVLVLEQIYWLYLTLIFILPFFGIDKYLVSDAYTYNKMKSFGEQNELVGSEGDESEEVLDGGMNKQLKKYLKEDLEGYIEIAKHENSSELLNKKYEHTSIVQKHED